MSREEDRFSRSNFAPLPKRHDDLPLHPSEGGASGSAPGAAMGEGDRAGGGGGYAGRRSFGANSASDGFDRDRDRDRRDEMRIPPPREYPSHDGRAHGGGGGGGYGNGGYGGGGGPGARGGGYERPYNGGGAQRDRRDSWVGARDGRAPPPWEDDYDRPKRRRSPSPSYAAHRPRHRSPSPPYSRPPYPPAPGHSHAPPAASGPGANSSLSNAPLPPRATHSLPDPASLEYLLPFRQFSEWFRLSHPTTAKADSEAYALFKAGVLDGSINPQDPKYAREKVGMGKRYERYRKEFTGRQLYSLFLSHRESKWFKEKYGVGEEEKEARKKGERRGRGREGRRYVKELGEGKWDAVCYDHKETSTSDQPSALDRPLDVNADEDEPARIEVPPKPKQVFVKTVPPTIGRTELEAFFGKVKGFEYLALTEPSVKKQFHRVAWAQFAEGVDVGEVVGKLDGQKIDNFTLHMGANTAPTVGRLRLTHGIANSLPRLRRDAELAKALAVKLEEGFIKPEETDGSEAGDNAIPTQTQVKVEPAESAPAGDNNAVTAAAGSSTAEAAAEVEVKKEEGTEAAADAGTASATEKDAEAQPEATEEAEVDIAEEGWHAPHERPSLVVQARIEKLIAEQGLDGEESEMAHDQLVQKYKVTLDQWISYLRNGLHTCYYCVAPMGYPEELQRKCIGHLRSPAPANVAAAAGENREGGADVDADMEERVRGDDRDDRDRGHEESQDKGDADTGAAGDAEAADGADEVAASGKEKGDASAGEEEEGKMQLDKPDDGPDTEHGVEHRRDISHRDRELSGMGYHKSNEEKWEEGLERKLAPLLGEVDIHEYYGKDIEEETRRLTAPYIKQEEESKYRCKECSKLFKAPSFLIKHVVAKHGELVSAQLDDYAVFNNFVLDPQHLSPTNTTPAAVDDKLPLAPAGQSNMGMPMMGMGMGVPAFNPANLPGGGGGGGEGMQQQQQQMMMMMMQMQQAMMMQMHNMGGAGAGAGAGGANGGAAAAGMAGAGGGGGRLQDRMGGYANDNMASSGKYSGSYNGNTANGAAGGSGAAGAGGAPRGAMGTQIGTPGKEDPRAKRGRVSYQDLDEVGGGEGGGLPY